MDLDVKAFFEVGKESFGFECLEIGDKKINKATCSVAKCQIINFDAVKDSVSEIINPTDDTPSSCDVLAFNLDKKQIFLIEIKNLDEHFRRNRDFNFNLYKKFSDSLSVIESILCSKYYNDYSKDDYCDNYTIKFFLVHNYEYEEHAKEIVFLNLEYLKEFHDSKEFHNLRELHKVEKCLEEMNFHRPDIEKPRLARCSQICDLIRCSEFEELCNKTFSIQSHSN